MNLSQTGITATDPDTATSLIKMLQVNKSLTHLDLSSNRSLSLEAHCFFKGLQYNTSLVDLNLSQTGITATDPDTATSLIKMLQVNKSLTHLDLSSNRSLSLEAHCFFKGLQYNTSLVDLNLSQTGITATDPDTATSLIKMLQVNKPLTHLDLSSNRFSDSYIIKSLQSNTATSNLTLTKSIGYGYGYTCTEIQVQKCLIVTLVVKESPQLSRPCKFCIATQYAEYVEHPHRQAMFEIYKKYDSRSIDHQLKLQLVCDRAPKTIYCAVCGYSFP